MGFKVTIVRKWWFNRVIKCDIAYITKTLAGGHDSKEEVSTMLACLVIYHEKKKRLRIISNIEDKEVTIEPWPTN